MRITWLADMRSLRPPSCWSVDVMNGGLGRLRHGFSSMERTVYGCSSSRARRLVAVGSSTTATSSRVTRPSWPKSRPVATRLPSSATSRAVKAGSVGKAAVRSQ